MYCEWRRFLFHYFKECKVFSTGFALAPFTHLVQAREKRWKIPCALTLSTSKTFKRDFQKFCIVWAKQEIILDGCEYVSRQNNLQRAHCPSVRSEAVLSGMCERTRHVNISFANRDTTKFQNLIERHLNLQSQIPNRPLSRCCRPWRLLRAKP